MFQVIAHILQTHILQGFHIFSSRMEISFTCSGSLPPVTAASRPGIRLSKISVVFPEPDTPVMTSLSEKREYDRLLAIRDNYPKYVLTTDGFAGGNYKGIKTMHVADFLLSQEF